MIIVDIFIQIYSKYSSQRKYIDNTLRVIFDFEGHHSSTPRSRGNRSVAEQISNNEGAYLILSHIFFSIFFDFFRDPPEPP